MRVILSGGGEWSKNPSAYKLFADSVDKKKPVLYLCFANLTEEFPSRYGGFAKRAAEIGIYSTRLCNDTSVFDEFDLSQFGGIFCSGGNTFRLMKKLRDCGADKKIRQYLLDGGVWLGCSAGAVIGGADIQPIIYMDCNAVTLEDTRGLDMMNGWSTIAHYGNSDSAELNIERFAIIEQISKRYDKLVALSEESAIVIEKDRKYIIGAPCTVYENGIAKTIDTGCEF